MSHDVDGDDVTTTESIDWRYDEDGDPTLIETSRGGWADLPPRSVVAVGISPAPASMSWTMINLKKQIPALAGGLILAGCGDGTAADSQFLSDSLVDAIEAFCIAATECEDLGYTTEGCMAIYQAQISSFALVFGMDADCEAAYVASLNCSAETDCEDETDACETLWYAQLDACSPVESY